MLLVIGGLAWFVPVFEMAGGCSQPYCWGPCASNGRGRGPPRPLPHCRSGAYRRWSAWGQSDSASSTPSAGVWLPFCRAAFIIILQERCHADRPHARARTFLQRISRRLHPDTKHRQGGSAAAASCGRLEGRTWRPNDGSSHRKHRSHAQEAFLRLRAGSDWTSGKAKLRARRSAVENGDAWSWCLHRRNLRPVRQAHNRISINVM